MLDNPLDVENNFGYLIGRLSRTMIRMLEDSFQNAGFKGMRIEHWFALRHLWEADGMTQIELGKLAGRDKTGVSRAVDWLEKQNYVLRVTDQQDRRNKRIYLTHAGKELKLPMIRCAMDTLGVVLGGIEEEEQEACMATLRKIMKNIKPHM